MANQYINASYVDAYLGANVRAALFIDEGGTYSSANFNTLCEAATAVIETALRNTGYTPPTGTPADITGVSEFIKMATVGVFREMASSRPEQRLPLPADWNTSFFKTAYEAILSGDAKLDEELIAVSAIGGIYTSVSDDTISSSDGSRPQIFGRKGMAVT